MTLCHDIKRGPAKGCLTALAQLRTANLNLVLYDFMSHKARSSQRLSYSPSTAAHH
jgi:hypothetical protein